jgi:hypothetical protein
MLINQNIYKPVFPRIFSILNKKGGKKFKMLKERRAQAQVITTILIILLVLAVIIIVWQVITRTVETGGQTLEAQSQCLGVSLDITEINSAANSVSITRRPGGTSEKDDVRILVEETNRVVTAGEADSKLGPVESDVYTMDSYDIQEDNKVEVAAVVNPDSDNPVVCGISDDMDAPAEEAAS